MVNTARMNWLSAARASKGVDQKLLTAKYSAIATVNRNVQLSHSPAQRLQPAKV